MTLLPDDVMHFSSGYFMQAFSKATDLLQHKHRCSWDPLHHRLQYPYLGSGLVARRLWEYNDRGISVLLGLAA